MTQSYKHPHVLVNTQWVDEHLNDSSIVIVEVNSHIKDGYAKGHLPGSICWELHTDLEHHIRRDIPEISQFEKLMDRSGISNDTKIVLYGDGNNRSATWAFWILKYYRHQNVLLMNGGRKKWAQDGRRMVTTLPDKNTSTKAVKKYKVTQPDYTLRAMQNHVLDKLQNCDVHLLDTRSLEEYMGLLTSDSGSPQADIYRKGRIPGAIHVPWDDNCMKKDGTFKSYQELTKIYSDAGIAQSNEIIPYCRLGVRASYTWFVLKYLLGYQDVRNYDGSWTEWGNATGLPIEIDPTISQK